MHGLYEDEGQDLIEYALVVALIAFAAVVGMNTVASGNQRRIFEGCEQADVCDQLAMALAGGPVQNDPRPELRFKRCTVLYDFWVNTVVLVTAACIDVRTRAYRTGFPFRSRLLEWFLGILTAGASGLLVSLEGTALALLLFGWVWALKGMGMGDLKLAAGVGAWIGPGSVCHGVRYDWHCGRNHGSPLCGSPKVPGQES